VAFAILRDTEDEAPGFCTCPRHRALNNHTGVYFALTLTVQMFRQDLARWVWDFLLILTATAGVLRQEVLMR
jgi:hypothetical protein